MPAASPELREKQAALEARLRAAGPLLVAFSGGVDSSYLALAAWRALGARALAVTAVSPSYPESHRRVAERFENGALRLFDEAAGGDPGVGGGEGADPAVLPAEAKDVEEDRRLKEPGGPELPARQAPPARQQQPATAPGEERHDEPQAEGPVLRVYEEGDIGRPRAEVLVDEDALTPRFQLQLEAVATSIAILLVFAMLFARLRRARREVSHG